MGSAGQKQKQNSALEITKAAPGFFPGAEIYNIYERASIISSIRNIGTQMKFEYQAIQRAIDPICSFFVSPLEFGSKMLPSAIPVIKIKKYIKAKVSIMQTPPLCCYTTRKKFFQYGVKTVFRRSILK